MKKTELRKKIGIAVNLFVVSVGFSVSVFSSASTTVCVGTLNEKREGFFESWLRKNEERRTEIEKLAETLVARLDLGGDGWQALDPALIATVTESVAEYNHTAFDVLTPERRAALGKLKTSLQNSSIFGHLDSESISNLTHALTNGHRRLSIPMFGPKHMLYHSMMELHLNNSQALTRILIELQGLGKELREIRDNHSKIQNALSHGLKGVTGVEELMARYAKVQQELSAASEIPQDLITQLVSIAKEYNASNRGAYDVLTPGHHEAMKKYDKLVSEHPFFKGADSSMMETLRWQWNRATSKESVIYILSPFVETETVVAKRMELRSLGEAIELIRNYRP